MDADRIEREILIAAPLERVWSLVIEPGFWLGDGDTTPLGLREGALVVADYPGYGRYPMRIVAVEPPHYIAYRWASTFPGEEPREANSTLVELTLTAEEGSTRLRVVESGFAGLDAPEAVRHKSLEENSHGWATELDGLRQRAEQ